MLKEILCTSIVLLLSNFALAQNADTPSETAPPTQNAGNEDLPPTPVKYTEEQVEDFLQQFVGVWAGDYEIATMQGQTLKKMEARVQYEWDLVDKKRVLKGQSVYAVGGQMSHATSLTYFNDGRMITEVEQEGKKRFFRGHITPNADGVSWEPNTNAALLTSNFKEVFKVLENGQRSISISGYEEVRQDIRVAYVAVRGNLTEQK